MSQIPVEWKLANFIPIHKQGNKNHVENYRPISLLSIVSKTLERCILNHISQYIQSNIHSAQFGFVNGRCCATQLLSILNIVGKNLDNGLQTDVVFMDIARRSILLTTPRCCKNCGNMVSPVLYSSDLKITYVDACSGQLFTELPRNPCLLHLAFHKDHY